MSVADVASLLSASNFFATEAAVEDCLAQVTPEHKLHSIGSQQAKGKWVAGR